MTITRVEAEQRVAKGAALLDAIQPDWAHRIDTGTLDLQDPCLCVLGQLYENFYYVVREDLLALYESHGLAYEEPVQALQLSLGLSAACGFRADDKPMTETDLIGTRICESYHVLQDAWIAAISDRVVPEAGAAPQINTGVERAVARA